MRLKEGARWPGDMHPSMWYARAVVGMTHLEITGAPGTITSGMRDQSPGGSSLHPLGRALDLRVWALPTTEDIRGFAALLRERLGPDFDVIVEGPAAEDVKYLDRPPHIHVEYDPKAYG